MNNEIIVPAGLYIVSETDLKGRITEINEEFEKITGYYRDEVIGEPHNILRHEDMPKEAFEDLWKTIKGGKTWRGFVKNKAKNGDFYWVYATVSPINRLDGFSGYTSIRQGMTPQEIRKEEMKLKEFWKDKERTVQGYEEDVPNHEPETKKRKKKKEHPQEEFLSFD